jgi:hypothetical protein
LVVTCDRRWAKTTAVTPLAAPARMARGNVQARRGAQENFPRPGRGRFWLDLPIREHREPALEVLAGFQVTYYSPYYRHGASMKKLPNRAGLRAIPTTEAAGIEDLKEGTENSNRDVTLPRTLRKLFKIFIPPRSIACR